MRTPIQQMQSWATLVKNIGKTGTVKHITEGKSERFGLIEFAEKSAIYPLKKWSEIKMKDKVILIPARKNETADGRIVHILVAEKA